MGWTPTSWSARESRRRWPTWWTSTTPPLRRCPSDRCRGRRSWTERSAGSANWLPRPSADLTARPDESAEKADDVLRIGSQRGGDRFGQRRERSQRHLTGCQRPGRDGAAGDEREGAEDPVDRDDAGGRAEHRLPVDPAVQQRVERAEQPRRREVRGLARPAPPADGAGRELSKSVRAWPEFGGDRVQPAPRVPQRQASPFGQVTLARGAMPHQVPSRQLGQGHVTVETTRREPGGRRAEPVTDPGEGMRTADHRPADDQSPLRG